MFYQLDPGSVRKDYSWERMSKKGLRHLNDSISSFYVNGAVFSLLHFRGVPEEVRLGESSRALGVVVHKQAWVTAGRR